MSERSTKVGAQEGQRTLGRVLLEDELLLKVDRRDGLDEEPGRDDELLFRVVGVVDEGVVLGERPMSAGQGREIQLRWLRTHSPPSILRARYMPMAAILLGFARRKRWSRRVTSMRNLESVRVWMS